jgi:hypothetical protein
VSARCSPIDTPPGKVAILESTLDATSRTTSRRRCSDGPQLDPQRQAPGRVVRPGRHARARRPSRTRQVAPTRRPEKVVPGRRSRCRVKEKRDNQRDDSSNKAHRNWLFYTEYQPSRRPDSNRGPLHYELLASRASWLCSQAFGAPRCSQMRSELRSSGHSSGHGFGAATRPAPGSFWSRLAPATPTRSGTCIAKQKRQRRAGAHAAPCRG